MRPSKRLELLHILLTIATRYPHRRCDTERGTSLLGGDVIWEAFQETIWVRAIASQNLPRGNWETILWPLDVQTRCVVEGKAQKCSLVW